jgi:hypothetical protein
MGFAPLRFHDFARWHPAGAQTGARSHVSSLPYSWQIRRMAGKSVMSTLERSALYACGAVTADPLQSLRCEQLAPALIRMLTVEHPETLYFR